MNISYYAWLIRVSERIMGIWIERCLLSILALVWHWSKIFCLNVCHYLYLLRSSTCISLEHTSVVRVCCCRIQVKEFRCNIIWKFNLNEINNLLWKTLNQVIVWDKIIPSVKAAKLLESNEHVKYSLVDAEADLRCTYSLQAFMSNIIFRGKSITLRLMWDHMPITGRLYTGTDGNSTFTFPKKYPV